MLKTTFYFLVILMGFLVREEVLANDNIKNSVSPYVAMHAKDTIQWSEWGRDVLARAKKENKPLFLTIGYFSCYWCHVLQRESFKQSDTATILNRDFISVVVDRELFPVLDARLMSFAEKTLGHGGWPLNVVITPEGYPFMATLYLPQIKFRFWLSQVNELWRKDPNYIRVIAKNAADELNFSFTLKKDDITPNKIKKIVSAFNRDVLTAFDEMEGGFGSGAKFPLSAILQVTLSLYEKNKSDALKENLRLTLKNMFERGMYDHLQGGFFRYTTDPGWHVPHFEKMLYDNAQLASLYFRAGRIFTDPGLIDIGKQTLDFMLSHLKAPNGGFYGSFSAVDEKGVEGGYYVWERKDWENILSSDEAKVISIAWDWSNLPIIIEGHLPVFPSDIKAVSEQTTFSLAKINRLIERSKKKLRIDQNKRVLPRDEKIIASWNALTLIALIDGYETTHLNKYQQAAQNLVRFMQMKLMPKNKLQRSMHRGLLAGNADLEDYALVALSFDRWGQLSGEVKYIKVMNELLSDAWERYFSDAGWKMSDDLLIPYGSSESLLTDGPLPSASAVLIGLGLNSNDPRIKSKAIHALQLGHSVLLTEPFWYASQVGQLMKFSAPQEKH